MNTKHLCPHFLHFHPQRPLYPCAAWLGGGGGARTSIPAGAGAPAAAPLASQPPLLIYWGGASLQSREWSGEEACASQSLTVASLQACLYSELPVGGAHSNTMLRIIAIVNFVRVAATFLADTLQAESTAQLGDTDYRIPRQPGCFCLRSSLHNHLCRDDFGTSQSFLKTLYHMSNDVFSLCDLQCSSVTQSVQLSCTLHLTNHKHPITFSFCFQLPNSSPANAFAAKFRIKTFTCNFINQSCTSLVISNFNFGIPR